MLSQKKGEPWDVDLSTPRKDCLLPTLLNRSVFIPIPILKECSNYCTTALISHDSKVMLKILQARLQQYMNQELPYVKLDFKKAEGPEIKLPAPVISQKKTREFQKKTSASLTVLKPLTAWITTNCGKYFKKWNTRPPYLPPEKSVCRSRSNSQNWTWNNRLVPKRKRSTSRLYIVTLLI